MEVEPIPLPKRKMAAPPEQQEERKRKRPARAAGAFTSKTESMAEAEMSAASASSGAEPRKEREIRKEVVNATEEMRGLQAMRMARNCDLLLEFAAKAEIAPIKAKITQAIGGKNVRSLNPCRTLEIRELDILKEEADLVADLAAATKLDPSQSGAYE